MRILIVTAGSRGDVAPFTGLGQRLQQAGHQVALAAHDRFAALVRDCGLEYRALPGDPVELARARTAAPAPEAARSVFAAFLDELGDGVMTAAAPSPPDDWPICHGFSPAVVPRPADWPANVHVTGYWWPARSAGWQPPEPLVDFLRAGPPPVFVGFGSMTPTHERLQDVVAVAVKRAGVRAVVQSGWAELGPVGDNILLVGDLPHDWLFPRTAAVVHHAGAGTTG